MYVYNILLLDLEARPTDFQIEERFLRSAVDKFHARRYSQHYVCIHLNVINFVIFKYIQIICIFLCKNNVKFYIAFILIANY